MKKLGCLLSLLLFFFVMSGCLHKQSARAKEVQLKKDTLSLKHLNQAYKEGKIDALTYVKEYNILKQRIENEQEMLGNGHTHTH